MSLKLNYQGRPSFPPGLLGHEYLVSTCVPWQCLGGAGNAYPFSGHREGIWEARAVPGKDGDLCFCGAHTAAEAQKEVSKESG